MTLPGSGPLSYRTGPVCNHAGRRHLGDSAALLQHAQDVVVGPLLHDLAPGKATHPDPRDRHLLAGRGQAQQRAVVGAPRRKAIHHRVPVGHHVLNGDVGIRESPAVRGDKLLGALRSARVPDGTGGTQRALLHGFVLCGGCGGPLIPRHGAPSRSARQGQYVCLRRDHGQGACREPNIAYGLADAAVLAELCRPQRAPWTEPPLETLVQRDPHAGERARLRAELAQAEAQLKANAVAFAAVGDISDHAVKAFWEVAQTLSERIDAVKAQMTALPEWTGDAEGARRLYERFRQMELPDLIAGLQATGDRAGVREVLASFIASARLEVWNDQHMSRSI